MNLCDEPQRVTVPTETLRQIPRSIGSVCLGGPCTCMNAACGITETNRQAHSHQSLSIFQVTYNGRQFNDFTVQRAATYIEQTDEHIAELTCALVLRDAENNQNSPQALAHQSWAGLRVVCDWYQTPYMRAETELAVCPAIRPSK